MGFVVAERFEILRSRIDFKYIVKVSHGDRVYYSRPYEKLIEARLFIRKTKLGHPIYEPVEVKETP